MTEAASPPTVMFVDTVRAVGVHNGVLRIEFIRLNASGNPVPALELVMPAGQASALAKAIGGIAR